MPMTLAVADHESVQSDTAGTAKMVRSVLDAFDPNAGTVEVRGTVVRTRGQGLIIKQMGAMLK
jgi:hypothetical protein